MFKIILSLCTLFPISVFALGMDVTANIPSGTYHSPIRIILTPSEPLAKTFYSFKPDGTPNDAFLYTGSILLKHSTPFIYFSFLTTDNESKIKQNNYIFEYPGSIQFETDTITNSGSIETHVVNNGKDSLDIGWWYVQSEISTVVIPEGTILAPGAKYSLKIPYSGTSSIVLRSPDDEEKDILMVQTSTSPTPPTKKNVITKVVPRKIISIVDTPQKKAEVVPVLLDTPTAAIVEDVAPSTDKVSPVNNATISSPSPQVHLNQIVKISATESGSKNMNPLYLVGFLLISFAIGGFQWFYMRKKQQ